MFLNSSRAVYDLPTLDRMRAAIVFHPQGIGDLVMQVIVLGPAAGRGPIYRDSWADVGCLLNK